MADRRDMIGVAGSMLSWRRWRREHGVVPANERIGRPRG